MNNSPSRINALPIPSLAEAILPQLERILDSPYFQSSKQLSRFLQFVVKESVAGRGEKLSQYTIAVEALGREPDFDPQTDPVIRIEARRLRQTLALYYQQEGHRDPLRIEIPSGRYAPIFRRNWAAAEQRPAPRLVSDAGPLDSKPTAKGSEGPTVALVNFACPSPDLEERVISLTEDLAAALSRFEFIKLIRPLTAENCLELSGKDGDDCTVHYVLEGTLHRWGEGSRLLCRLRDPNTNELLWSESFLVAPPAGEVPLSPAPLIHRLASAIGDFHGVLITHWTQHAVCGNAEIPAHHDAFIRVRHFHNRLDLGAFREALQACERALRRWPEDALTNSLFADLCVVAYYTGLALIDSPLQRAEKAACDAVALQPAYHFTRFALGKVYFAKGERGPCLAEFGRCLALNPYSASVGAWIGMYLCLLGDWERGRQLVTASRALTPDNVVYHFTLALAHYRQGAFEAAWTEARRLHMPDLFWDSLVRAACLGQLSRRAEAQRELTELLRLCPDFKTRGRAHLRRLLFSEDNVAMLMDGLHKAGFADAAQ